MYEEENNKKTNKEFENENINTEEDEYKQINSIINNNNFYHSIIEKHDKINNDNSDIQNNIEEDIKEEIIIESSSSNSNRLKFNNETSSNKNNVIPISIKTKDLKNIRKQKLKLNNSFKLSSKKNLISSLNELNKFQNNKVNLSNNFSKENIKKDFLPRINSSQSIKKKPELKKSEKNKKIHSEIPFKKKSKLFLSSPKNIKTMFFNQNKKENELINIENEHLELIHELKQLNIQLTTLINKQIPQALINFGKIHSENNILNSSDIIRKNNILTKKKLLTNLILEYNTVYKKFALGNDLDIKNELENKLRKIKEEYNTHQNFIKQLKDKIIKNEIYLKNMKIQETITINDNKDLKYKIELYNQKIFQMKNEILQMKNLSEKENTEIFSLNNKYSKYKELISYYDETPKSIEEKLKISAEYKKKQEEINYLRRKKDIMSHSRNMLNKKYLIEINQQNKYIEKLNSIITEVDNILSYIY